MSASWKRWLLDTGERTARTFVQGFLGAVTLDALTTHVNLDLLHQLELGALAGAYGVLTAFAAKGNGAPDSASFLPADVDPPQPPDA